MSNPSKQKGNRVERIIVDIIKSNGFDAMRAWGSNGKALGHHEEVDIVMKHWNLSKVYGGIKIQSKARKKIAEYMKPNLEIVDWQVIKEDREDPLVVLPLKDLLKIIKGDEIY